VLVHDANLGEEALARGCVDLVLGGHLHLQVGPDPVVGANGKTGYMFTTGTTGGAAYAIAIGGKVRRPAQVTLVTYADGRPVGLQGVVLQSNGTFVVTDFLPLDYDD
ncbi:MAG: metallophosphoesterase, partial [Nocardioides sp.]|nr:metallophosphoesterase [Nocardioides sp.]